LQRGILALHSATPLPSRRKRGSSQQRNATRSARWLKFIRKLIVLSSCALGALIVVGVVSLLYLRAQALPQITLQQTSLIVDRHGQWLDSFYNEQNRTVVTLSEISPKLVQATLAIEDHRFYSHFGVDPKAVVRASLINLKEGKKVQGAGTITQQLARNSYLSHERTWTRKWKETLFALQLELQYSKPDILEKYLNQIYYGHATYGIETASRLYFDKHARDLNVAESAMLAGIPKGPLYYSPYLDWDQAKKRQRLVLLAMAHHQYITTEEADAAAKQPLTIQPLGKRTETPAPYFRDYVKAQAMQFLNLTEEQLEQSGFKIYTSLDKEVQKKAESTIHKYVQNHPDLQVALVAMDPRNGYIQAMVGGRDYEHNQFNRVFSTTRQPGSAFKPFIYLEALRQGHTPLLSYRSEPTVFPYEDGKKSYAPQNFGNRYSHKSIAMRQAIATSDNMYAVHSILEVGISRVISLTKALGVQSELNALPSLALGTSPISPFDMMQAYSVIANQGKKVHPIAIVKIEDATGKLRYEAKLQSQRVLDAAPAYVMTHLMQSVFEVEGTAHRVAPLLKRPIAAKTGSTDTDSWMVGFTPELSTAVWLGYDRDRKIGAIESHLATPIFAEFTELALQDRPPQAFPKPDGVIAVDIDPVSGKMSNADCPKSQSIVFVDGTQPTDYCTPTIPETPSDDISEPSPQPQDDTWWKDLFHWWTT
jgi:1A family penicillin-binding protein